MDKIKKLINKEIEALQNIPLDGNLEKAVEEIYTHVHKNGGKVIISGVGKAGQIGMKLSTTLCSTGTPSCFLNPLDAQHGDLGIIQKNDVLFLISNSGETREILELSVLVKKLQKDICIIALTQKKESSLVHDAKVSIFTGETQEICPLGLTPTTSTTVMTVIGDLLTVLLIEKIGLTKEQYGLRHHSGYLGKKAKL